MKQKGFFLRLIFMFDEECRYAYYTGVVQIH